MVEGNLKYRRPDIEGGSLINKSDIEYYKEVRSDEVMDNQLLGDFNSKGEYVIKENILRK